LSGVRKGLDIEALRRKRALNVQEQNALVQHQLLQAATWFRTHLDEIPSPIREFLASRGINLHTAIDVCYTDMTSLGLDGIYSGLIITSDGRFWRWELALDENRSAIEAVEKWCDVTSKYPVSEHVRGTGKSYAFMCLTVLRQLNTIPKKRIT
jgi:hypothetical protein